MDYSKIRKKRSLPKHPRLYYDEDRLAIRRARNLRRQIKHLNNNNRSNESKQHKLLTQRNSGLQRNLNMRGLDKGGLNKQQKDSFLHNLTTGLHRNLNMPGLDKGGLKFDQNKNAESFLHNLTTGLHRNLNMPGLDKGGLKFDQNKNAESFLHNLTTGLHRNLNMQGLKFDQKYGHPNHKSYAFDQNKIAESFLHNLAKEFQNIPKSNQIPYTYKPFDLANTPPGTHIMAESHFDIINGPSIPITHHGVYLGDGKVIHYTTNPGNTNMFFDKGKVFVDPIEDFTDDISKIRAVEYPDGLVSRSTEDIINAALSREGEAKYNVLFNNCEHFANKSITGKAVSNQVERWKDLGNKTVVPVVKAVYGTGVSYGVDKLWDVIDHYPQERVDQVGEKIGKTVGAIGGEIVSKGLIEPIPIVGPILGPPVSAISEKMGEVIGGRYREIPTALEKVDEYVERKKEEEGRIDLFRIFGLRDPVMDLIAITERMITGESKLFENPGGKVFSGTLPTGESKLFEKPDEKPDKKPGGEEFSGAL